MINLSNDSSRYFNDIFENIQCSSDVKNVFSIAEYLASIERIDVSIDCIIFAILFYSKDKQIESNIYELCSADDYYRLLKTETEESAFKISFSKFAYDNHMQIFRPKVSDDVENLFVNLYDYSDEELSISLLFFEICKLCKNREFNKTPILYNLPNFDAIYKILDKEINFMRTYSTPLTIDFGTDLTYKAYQLSFDKIIGRNKELNHIMRILNKRSKNNPLLVGEPGVGKTHIIEALAELFVNGKVSQKLFGRRIISLNTAKITAGTKYRGDLEENVSNFISQVKGANAIVFIDEIHTICNSLSSESTNISDLLKPYLLDPDICIIGATTTKEYKIIEKNSAIARRFDIVKVDEPTIPEATKILQGIKPYYEEFHGVVIPNEVVQLCVELSSRYIQTSSLPDKAIDILDESCAKLEIDSNSKHPVLRPADIYEIIAEKTGIPINSMTSENKSNLLNLEEVLNSQIIGQHQAISEIVRAIKKSKLDLNDSNRPLASFLFAGTTGVGKTETAKVLAKQYFGNANALIRFDMSEYQTNETVHRLTGASPGYIGYDEGGQLTNAVKNTPYSIVLFDEIEKAHPGVLNILLQILDDGQLTDSTGFTVNFRNTIIIMTSNIGADAVQKNTLGFGNEKTSDSKKETILSEIKKTLRPELVNRISSIVVYNSLSPQDCESIVELYITNFKNKLSKQGITLNVSKTVRTKIVETGYNSTYGAREIKRVFEREIVDKVVDIILNNNSKYITIDSTINGLSFSINNTTKKVTF